MVKTVLRLMHERPTLSFVADQRGCPTFTADLAPLLRRLGAGERSTGVFHATNQGAVSWYEFVRDIVAAAGGDPSMVLPITTADLQPPRPGAAPGQQRARERRARCGRRAAAARLPRAARRAGRRAHRPDPQQLARTLVADDLDVVARDAFATKWSRVMR